MGQDLVAAAFDLFLWWARTQETAQFVHNT